MKFYQKWEARIIDENNRNNYFSAEVPGNVQRDYAKHIGILDNIQFGTNVKKLEEVEDYYWEYRAKLDFVSEPGKRIYFVAQGIDYIFDILLDGETLHSQEGMYTPVELDLTDIAKNGSVLQVIIHPHPKMKGSEMRTRSEAAQACKPPMCYGWDWNPRLLVSGMWLPAYIEVRSEDFIKSCEPRYILDVNARHADVTFEIDCDIKPEITVFDPDGNEVYRGTDTSFSIDNVQLWWCNGQGKPNLYSWKAETKGDVKTGRIGFKNIRLVRGDDNRPRRFPMGPYVTSIMVELNGRRIFAKGTNLVNAEIFYGNTTADTHKKIVVSAYEAHMNIFRMWGGAGCAKPEFYDMCDEYGILVWQEFMMACNNYKGTPHFLSVLEQEAKSIIKKLRSHACLAFWCGGNELFNNWSGMSEQSYALRLLDKICYELDRSRPFIMTAPLMGMGHGGYTFYDKDGREVFEVFRESSNTAYSEFGVPSIAPVEQLQKIIPEDELFPITPTESWITHHAFKAWLENSWVHLDILERYFGKLESLEKTVEYSQWMQCEGYKAAFEEGRRQWPSCSMTLNWCFNEPWITAANNSLISYPDIKKPAYFSVKESLRDVMASARIPKFSWEDGEKLWFEIWYHNDTPEEKSNIITASVEIGGKVYKLLTWETGTLAMNTNKQGPTVKFTIPADISADKLIINLDAANADESSHYVLQYKCRPQKTKTRKMNM